ncbi:MAG: CHAT domain-containing protein [Caldimonas sp.]
MTGITFIVPGQAEPVALDATSVRGRVKASIRVGTQRGGGEPVVVTAQPGDDVVVLSIANGPTLVLHPADARDLMLAQSASATRSSLARGPGDGPPGAVSVPPQLAWPGLEAEATRGSTRGWMGQVLLSGFHVVAGLAKDPAENLVAAAITRHVDGGVDAGVYRLGADTLEPLKGSGRKLAAVPAAADGGPMLVLIHGTFVDTAQTFGKLWTLHNGTVRDLFAGYADRVYALDHPTLGQSPIANALTLVRALPAGARLHLLTHSRGGLVAEVLARACAGEALGAEALGLFAGAAYAAHRNDLRALVKEAKAKALRIERVVRVACPARGTLLASRRLDAYLSILKWGLELGGVPVAPQLVDFLHEVARRRTDPAELPGLEAMMPSSPVVAWLNQGTAPIPGDLRVVAGDLDGDSIGSWVKTLLADAFYWTDNDLVVQTRSMYGGALRAPAGENAGASFLLDRGGKVSHFNYFVNERTVEAIAQALLADRPAEFEPIGPLSWAGADASGTRAARATATLPAGDAADRPAVFVIPGILGSNLKRDGERIWVGFRFINGLKSLAWDPATAARVESDGPIESVYGALMARLADSHDVVPFAFDWRRPIEDEGRRLADAVDAALEARSASGQPVRILAHSMGGLVARAMALERPETWRRLLARDGARLLMLGTPNGGSWSPMQTLSGDDNFGNALAAFGSLFDDAGGRAAMAGMPGFLQLQADLLDPALGLDRAASWQRLAEQDMARLAERSIWHLEGAQQIIYQWGAPPQAVLDQAVALRRRLDDQAAALGADAQKMLLVVGHAPFTPCGFTFGDDGLEYLDTPDGGDGRVPLASALLPGVRTWKLDASHGDLPSAAKAFEAYVQLLRDGETQLLDRVEEAGAATRSGGAGGLRATATAALVRSRPSHGLLGSRPPSSAAEMLGGSARPGAGRGTTAGAALHVVVLNGDLKFVHQALVVGHYRSIVLSGTEGVVDRLVGHAMSRSLAAGLYPDAPGTHQTFGNVRKDPNNVLAMARPLAVVVAGLGEEGKLRAVDLAYTVRQATIAYAQRLAEQPQGAPAEFELASTLMGSGGTGISAGTSAQLIAQGVYEANKKLAENGWPQVGRLLLVEFYLDRASDAWRALEVQATAAPGQLKLLGPVQSGAGALKRSLDSSYRGSAYDLVSVVAGAPEGGEATIAYTLDTRRARTEVRAQQTQGSLVRELVAKASNDANRDSQIGRTLFDLLVPVEMEPFLGGTSEMVIELDGETSGIPWELLDTAAGQSAGTDPRPWAIRSKLLRKLRTREFRAQPSDANADCGVFVVGEPLVDDSRYPPLPGARAEASAVAACLGSGAAGVDARQIRALTSGADDARTIINALFERPYRIVHIAGHGEPGARGGVVLSGGTFLGPAEVKAMRTVPELVFLNCCHLAARDVNTVLQRYDRAAFAANIAEALIEIGVRCVVAAGWAVEDEPAEVFATTFYKVLLGGGRFIDAVAAARGAAWQEHRDGNTWAAYQCYGDPGWRWSRSGGETQRVASSPGDEFAAVSSPVALALALETLSVRLRFGGDEADHGAFLHAQSDKIRFLESKFAPLWGTMGAVAETFGLAWGDAHDVDKSIEWYRTAVEAGDGSATFRAGEQLGNQLARRGERQDDPVAGRRDIDEAIERLEKLLAIQPTAEREALLGSAYKRLVMLEGRAAQGRSSTAAERGRRRRAAGARLDALRAMARHYGEAERLARAAGAANLFYPAKNGISAELRLAFLERRPAELALDRAEAVRESLERAATDRPDFWSVVGQIELRLLVSLASRQLAGSAPTLIGEFRELKARVPAPHMWDSVHSEARFTLEPYEGVASAAEKRAARALLEALEAMATATP